MSRSATTRRALVCQHRFPEHDRERGSLRVLELIDGLLVDGWHVTFAATSEDPAPRYRRELARRGVPCHTGWGPHNEPWVRAGDFDLAIVAFWHVAEIVAPDLRAWSPQTTVVVDSIDLHFVREARRRVVASPRRHFDESFGDVTSRELEVYRDADGVLCVSDEERRLLDGVLGTDHARTVVLGEDTPESPLGVTERVGLLFVGNFRHLPNAEALAWAGSDVLGRLDPELLDRHPLRVVGNAVDDRIRDLCRSTPGVDLVGWVPSVTPELHRARVGLIPLRHGAGVKGKTLQALAAGTPVVSTPIGVEGIAVVGDAALIRESPRSFAEAVTALATDDDLWNAAAADAVATARGHRRDVAARQLATAVADLLDRAARHRERRGVDAEGDTATERGSIEQAVAATARPDDLVMVAGDDRPLAEAARLLGDAPGRDCLVVVPSTAYRTLHTDRRWLAWLRSGDGLVFENDDCRVHRPDPAQLPAAPDGAAPDLAAAPSPGDAAPPVGAVAGQPTPPAISVVVATFDRAALLDRCLTSIGHQTMPPGSIEVVVVDDGSTDATATVLERWRDGLRLVSRRTVHGGRSRAKNTGISLATAPVILLLDDDDELAPDACARHVEAHERHPGAGDVVLGHTDWAPDLDVTPFMSHIIEDGCQLFAYPSLSPDTPLDWRHFWEGRLSIKADLVALADALDPALHDERLPYTIDVEWAYRLQGITPLTVYYQPDALQHMTRPVGLDEFCARARAKGRAQWRISRLHPAEEMQRYCDLGLLDAWPSLAGTIDLDRLAIGELEERIATGDRPDTDELARLGDLYRRIVRAHVAWGLADARAEDEGRPAASVVVPVWSAVPHLVETAQETVDRIRSVSEDGTEIVVVDNGSPHGPTPAGDAMVRNPHNLGVAPAWNQGIRLARGEVVIVVNSDCIVEPGWDRALRHAAIDGRRVAFPYTDHGDGKGLRPPDQAGTAGWCFALRRELFEELGPFDVGFVPAFFEDTDYWHRAWQLGVELTPVPAAEVSHRRRTTAQHLADVSETFVLNRRRYEAKHGLPVDATPPFWRRRVHEYPPPASVRLWGGQAAEAPDPDDPARPRVFGIGLSKTATSSLHAALAHLGFRSVHHGTEEFRDTIAAALTTDVSTDASTHRNRTRPLDTVDPTLDAFCDVPAVVEHYALLDAAYPGSRFVLTIRDLDDLVDSHRRHAAHNRALRDAGLAHGVLLDVDEDELRGRAALHLAAAAAHFAGRPDQLLILDICGGDGWADLAPFLGWERLPERPFPWENPSPDEPAHEAAVARSGVA